MTDNHLPKGIVQGKTALVTGGASGIGLASAIRLAEQGASVTILDVDEGDLKEAAERIAQTGAECLAIKADITCEEEVAAAVKQVTDKWERLDILFANAGINGVLAPIDKLELADWENTVAVNLTGTFLCVKHAIGPMKQNGGSIIITSSINGNRVFSNFGFGAYSTTKAGQVAFAKMAALELARYSIRVNAICPGAIKTNIGENTERTPEVDQIAIPIEFPEGDHPLRHKPGDASQVANVVLFLSSELSNHVTGTAVFVDGAESLLHG